MAYLLLCNYFAYSAQRELRYTNSPRRFLQHFGYFARSASTTPAAAAGALRYFHRLQCQRGFHRIAFSDGRIESSTGRLV